MNRVTLIMDKHYYWVKDIMTKEICVALCLITDLKQGAVFQTFGSSFRRRQSNYLVLAHIPYPDEPDPNDEEVPEPKLPFEDNDPNDPVLIDDFDDGEWEQDIYNDEDEWEFDEDWDDDMEDDIFNEDPGR